MGTLGGKRPGAGRLKLPAQERYSITVFVRVKPRTYLKLTALAKAKRQTLKDYLRNLFDTL